MNLVSLSLVLAVIVTVGGGCAPSTVVSPPGPSDAGARPPATEAPTNFASPEDMLQRYPMMRRQQL